MEYTCSVCGEKVDGDLTAFIDHTETHIIEVIKERHPEWVEKDGVCKKCLEHFRDQIRGAQ